MIEAAAVNHGRSLSSRYTLLEKLGAGGQAEVWRARDETAGVEVALKILNPALAHNESAWAALVREHSIASRLEHPTILKVQPPYREGDFVALPMELASGGDLRRLRGKGYLDIIPVLIDIAQALEYAHEQGVIHRDLKPGNVLFDARGRVRLADFGIAGTPGEANAGLARPGLSPFTASPEQLRGDPPSIADDIYGLGALAYELLSGYPPYYPRFEVKRVLEEPVPELKPAQLMPPQLAAAIMRMLAKRAALRPRSMRDVIDDFDSALNDTLTFEFERIEETDAHTAAMRRDAAVIAAAETAKRAAVPPAPPPAAKSPEPAVTPADPPTVRPPEASVRETSPAMRAIDEELIVTGALAKRPEPVMTAKAEQLGAQKPDDVPLSAREPAAAPLSEASADRMGVMDVGPAGSRAEADRIAAAAAAVREAAPHLAGARTPPTHWDDVRLHVDPSPAFHRTQRPHRRSWPWVVLTALAAAAAVVFVVLPKYTPTDEAGKPPASAVPPVANGATAPGTPSASSAPPAPSPVPPAGEPPATERPAAQPARASRETAKPVEPGIPDRSAAAVASGSAAPTAPAKSDDGTPQTNSQDRLAQARTNFDQRLAALEARGAGFWGGADFAAAKTRAAESVGANDAGSPRLAEQRLNEALRLLNIVESKAAQTLASQLATGDRALAAGQGEVAKQAYEFARRIDPNNRRASDGLQRTRNLGGVLPLIADGENAEAAKDYARAVQDYSQALSLDPNNVKARAGLDRAHGAFGDDSYAKAVGSGFASLGAGRLDDARVSFEKARTIRPSGAEAQTGLSRVGAALRARGFASTRQRGAGLEEEERWTEAAAEYDAALNVDPSLVFAQQGRARALDRAELNNTLQGFIDRPERLAAPAVRTEAETLLKRAAVQQSVGPVLRSQIARLQILLPEFDVPVRLELVSDNATQVQIQKVGTFGTFSRREIELKPGKYTVVGTRPGFRDVRRDVTIAPGRDVQTISVSCVEPI
jgi:tetratricopeptide (TPR) repeat protein